VALHPHNFDDIMLAPVALAIDARIEELAALTGAELDYRIALDANVDTSVPEQRRQGLLHALTTLIEMHGWEVSLCDRGAQLTNGEHSLVLGLPEAMRVYMGE
jgi:hypothetical protein